MHEEKLKRGRKRGDFLPIPCVFDYQLTKKERMTEGNEYFVRGKFLRHHIVYRMPGGDVSKYHLDIRDLKGTFKSYLKYLKKLGVKEPKVTYVYDDKFFHKNENTSIYLTWDNWMYTVKIGGGNKYKHGSIYIYHKFNNITIQDLFFPRKTTYVADHNLTNEAYIDELYMINWTIEKVSHKYMPKVETKTNTTNKK